MKRTPLSKTLAAAFCGILALVTAVPASACSYLFFTANGKVFIGRTNELPMETDEQLIIVPRGHKFHGVDVKHGFVGINHGNDPFVSSGLNEHGVSIEGLGFAPGFAPKGEGDMSMLNVPNYILGNASSTDEAIELLKKIKVENDNMTQFGDVAIGFHFAIHDGNRGIVVEYTKGDGTPDIHENTLGVMTNDPAYPTQVAMAQNLLDGEDYKTAQVKFAEGKFVGFDKTAEGRFQHIVAMNYSKDLTRVKTDVDAVNYAWSMVNVMDIPQGIVYWRFLSDLAQMTAYANVVDIENRIYYLRTHDNQDVRKVDLKKIDFSTVEFQKQDIYGTLKEYRELEIK